MSTTAEYPKLFKHLPGDDTDEEFDQNYGPFVLLDECPAVDNEGDTWIHDYTGWWNHSGAFLVYKVLVRTCVRDGRVEEGTQT